MAGGISAIVGAALYLGWHTEFFPTPLFLTGAAAIAALDLAFLFPFHLWKQDRDKIAGYEERLRPKIKILGIYSAAAEFLLHGMKRSFGMEIKNDSGIELSDCLAEVTDIEVYKRTNFDGAIENVTVAYKPHLPIALRTEANNARDGGGPFRLRAQQQKKILICSRVDGERSDLSILFEPGRPAYLYAMPSVTHCDLTIHVYHGSNPAVVKLHLEVAPNGELKMSIVDFPPATSANIS